MHPTPSIITFTVSSGAGFGLFMLVVLLNLGTFGAPLDGGETIIAGIIALALITIGLIASVFHLANPRNAWKAFNRFRTSWLSREGVLSLLFFPTALAYLWGIYINGDALRGWLPAVGLLAALLALATVFSTGMIYASLKTIRQWHNGLVPANYILIGLATGGVVLVVVRAFAGGELTALARIVSALLAATAGAKLIYYYWIGHPGGTSINTATGFTRAQVRLLSTGHSFGTFLTKEFGHLLPPGRSLPLRTAVFVFAFLLPIIILIALIDDTPRVYALIVVISVFIGIVIERWLFFTEAVHVVNLYHGRQRA